MYEKNVNFINNGTKFNQLLYTLCKYSTHIVSGGGSQSLRQHTMGKQIEWNKQKKIANATMGVQNKADYDFLIVFTVNIYKLWIKAKINGFLVLLVNIL